ncbi:uncharacterized protein LOC122266682 [Penaeus japonicus]|uniref:uncharacterized protein LOC122266682 n=1 Tax=Penaeus japonicus TaxID=27405 RepID=UPI001C70C503|nr:uncharacterized protein LOC122266682 [Penaeus japonicus]
MRRVWRAATMAALLISAANSWARMFLPGERGVRATSVVASPVVSSVVLCAAACSVASGCRGFNWRKTPRECDILSSLRAVESDPDSVIYVPEIQRASLALAYSCPSCMGQAPYGNSDWELDCSPPDGGVAVGVAALSSLDDLDYLICTAPPGLLLNINSGARISDDRICSEVLDGRPVPVTALWANQQFFSSPTSFRYQCREIISGEQLDISRCVVAQPTFGAVPGVVGPGHHLLLCPPHMIAAAISWGASGPTVTCCLLY